MSEIRPDAHLTSGDAALPFVSLRKITKAFGATLANAEIDLDVRAGDVIGLVGGNGAGKSTLMRILSGALNPTLGEIHFDGARASFVNYTMTAAQDRGIRMVHQEFSLCTNLSVAENFYVEEPGGAGFAPAGATATGRARRRRLMRCSRPLAST